MLFAACGREKPKTKRNQENDHRLSELIYRKENLEGCIKNDQNCQEGQKQRLPGHALLMQVTVIQNNLVLGVEVIMVAVIVH